MLTRSPVIHGFLNEGAAAFTVQPEELHIYFDDEELRLLRTMYYQDSFFAKMNVGEWAGTDCVVTRFELHTNPGVPRREWYIIYYFPAAKNSA